MLPKFDLKVKNLRTQGLDILKEIRRLLEIEICLFILQCKNIACWLIRLDYLSQGICHVVSRGILSVFSISFHY